MEDTRTIKCSKNLKMSEEYSEEYLIELKKRYEDFKCLIILLKRIRGATEYCDPYFDLGEHRYNSLIQTKIGLKKYIEDYTMALIKDLKKDK